MDEILFVFDDLEFPMSDIKEFDVEEHTECVYEYDDIVQLGSIYEITIRSEKVYNNIPFKSHISFKIIDKTEESKGIDFGKTVLEIKDDEILLRAYKKERI